MNAMNTTTEQSVLSKLRTLSPQQVAQVEDFIEFLARPAASKRLAQIRRTPAEVIDS
jgi:hypothetical protein